MKAVVHRRFGPPEVLGLEEVEKPAPGEGEVLVKVHAVGVTSGDVKLRSQDLPAIYWLPIRIMFGFRKPKNPIPGYALAGEVEAVGEGVSRFSPGDRVFGTTGPRSGACAEYVSLPEEGRLEMMPAGMGFEEAAALPVGATTALHFLGRANIRPGQKVLVYGASGSVGTYAVQLAKLLGAEVTGVCSAANIELVRSLGADRVLDYTARDFALEADSYDVVFETVGRSSFSDCLRALKRDGVLVLVAVFRMSWYVRALWTSITSRRKVISGVSSDTPGNMAFLAERVEAGELKVVIDRSYPLDQTAEAHRYVEAGHKKGNVVVTLQSGG